METIRSRKLFSTSFFTATHVLKRSCPKDLVKADWLLRKWILLPKESSLTLTGQASYFDRFFQTLQNSVLTHLLHQYRKILFPHLFGRPQQTSFIWGAPEHVCSGTNSCSENIYLRWVFNTFPTIFFDAFLCLSKNK